MNAEQKITEIKKKMWGVDPTSMTDLELQIRDMIEEVDATPYEKDCARNNSNILMEKDR